jgi:hypothetical protein
MVQAGLYQGTPLEAEEKIEILCPVPKGASDFDGLKVSLKRYPDTKLLFFRSLFRRAAGANS